MSWRRWAARGAYTAAITLLAAAAASGGVLAWRSFNPPAAQIAVTHAPALSGAELGPGDARPDFTLPDLDGTPRSVSEWDGQLLFVNFWATWCAPCLEEIPAFVRLQREFGDRGVQFLGVAIDGADNVRAFAAEHEMNYPSLIAEMAGIDLTQRYGNRIGALPYTVVVARDGRVIAMHHGVMKEEQVRELIASHL